MAIFVFDPTVLTNAPFVTTDMGAACGFFASVYTFYRFSKHASWARAVICGLAVGLTLAAKHSGVLLLPVLLLLAAGHLLLHRREHKPLSRRQSLHGLIATAAIAAVALTVLWGVYSFRYAMHPIGVEMPPMQGQMETLSAPVKLAITTCARFHLLPESYLYGLVDVQRVGASMPTYIFGKLYTHGQWFYFPALLSLKWSVGVLGLLVLTLYALATGRLRTPRETLYLVVPALFYLAVAMAGPLNIGVRHVLPVFPFTFALIGGGTAALLRQRRMWAYPVGSLLLWHAIDSVRMFPNYMPYANVLWGGPAKTHLYFSDSAVEWGQELKFVKAWTDAHGVQDCWFAYFPAPFLLPSDYGVPCKLLPTLDTKYEQDIVLPAKVHGPVLISFADLNGFEFGTKVRNPYQRLFERGPDEVIANGVAVFYGNMELPEAAALHFEQHAQDSLKKDPAASLRAAKEAVALVPNGFDANLGLGDAAKATGDPALAREAYGRAQRRIAEMEPTSQKKWGPVLEGRLAAVAGK